MSFGQSNYYDINEVRDVRLYFSLTNWDDVLDSFYIEGEEQRMLASVVIDGQRFDSVGVRYKGFSSVSIDRKKNPFNIKLDYVKNQSYQGIDKLKLSNVIQDPSFIRETLSYEIARKYMPASRANFANVYINDTFWGVYTNVEPVNKTFLQNHFGSSGNAFFKGNPENLQLNGENCNLSNTPGSDSVDYYGLYDKKSDAGWKDLLQLIDVLNTNPDTIESILNVDQTLWMHAFNYVLVNFDSYIGYAQNYYLYKDDAGLFNPIIWDLNQSFASYRLTDASDFFRGFTVSDAKTMDPLSHYKSVSVYPRSLMRNLFENDTYRRQYLAHIRTLVEENFTDNSYKERAQHMQTVIDEYVQEDVNKFYGYDDFLSNLDTTVKDLVDYPGITDLMSNRAIYLSTYPGVQGAPEISLPTYTISGDSVWVQAKITYSSIAWLKFRSNNVEAFKVVDMMDDGLHNDGLANDGLYGALIENQGTVFRYYVYAENDSAGRFSPERAAHEYYEINGDLSLVINEVSGFNTSIISDEEGEFDDWIELYNNSSETISLEGYTLTDDAQDLQKWSFPNVDIGPNDYLVVWADDDENDGELHTNFKLSSSGDVVYLTKPDGTTMDYITFSQQLEDVSFGRFPNGTGDFTYMNPTPNASNSSDYEDENELGTLGVDFALYPNPATRTLRLLFNQKLQGRLIIRNLAAQEVKNVTLHKDVWSYTFDVTEYTRGVYIISVINSNEVITKKFILR